MGFNEHEQFGGVFSPETTAKFCIVGSTLMSLKEMPEKLRDYLLTFFINYLTLVVCRAHDNSNLRRIIFLLS